MTEDGTTGQRGRSKVERVAEKYDRPELPDELVRRWTAGGDERMSLRDLASLFNRRILSSELRSVGSAPLEGEVENTYRLLTADDVTSGMRTQTERQLERDGVAISELRSDFVSHQAVYTYLTERRGVERGTKSDEERVETATNTIRRLVNRLRAVTETTLSGKVGDILGVSAFDVTVDVQVYCDRCERTYEVDELFSRGGCACNE